MRMHETIEISSVAVGVVSNFTFLIVVLQLKFYSFIHFTAG